MKDFVFEHTRTDTIAPNKLEEALQKELELLHHATASPDTPARFNNVQVGLAHMSRILAILSRAADIQTRRIVRLTWGLIALTVALLILTGYLSYDTYEKAKSHQEESSGHAKPTKAEP